MRSFYGRGLVALVASVGLVVAAQACTGGDKPEEEPAALDVEGESAPEVVDGEEGAVPAPAEAVKKADGKKHGKKAGKKATKKTAKKKKKK